MGSLIAGTRLWPKAKVVELDRLRCNCCGEVFKAPAPEGIGEEKYDETATSMISMLRYGAGTPFYRLAKLQSGLGIPLPAGTQWKLALEAAGLLEPAFQELITWAAQGDVIYQDDTTMKVLSRPDLMTRGTKQRKGVYTSGLISKAGENWVALFLTGMNHAGENLAEVLRRRKAELGRPIQMCDAAAANTSGDLDTIVAHCLAHARRRFVDVAEDFPEECLHLLESLREVYRNDAETKGMSPPERLRFHQEHSGPVMERLRAWLQDQLDQKRVEPNSGLGSAITYMLKHWERLTIDLACAGQLRPMLRQEESRCLAPSTVPIISTPQRPTKLCFYQPSARWPQPLHSPSPTRPLSSESALPPSRPGRPSLAATPTSWTAWLSS